MSETAELTRHIVAMADRLPEPHAGAVRGAVAPLAVYLLRLREANDAVNLVSRKSASLEELVERHLFDSLLGLEHLPRMGESIADSRQSTEGRPGASGRLRLVDIGSGGGFPALPLLIVRPDLEGVLVESVRKKSEFLKGVVREIQKEGKLTATVLNARFPDSLPMKDLTPVHILTSRAVAGAGKLVQTMRPALRAPGVALFWTTEPLYGEAVREAAVHRSSFHRAPGAESRGIAVLECFT